MKKLITLLLVFSFVLMPVFLYAKDVYVKGYYRKDGTYVRPHIRKAPNRYKLDNYGPSKKPYQLLNPRTRDYDRDGIPNFQDRDSDNDGIPDNHDPNPYGR